MKSLKIVVVVCFLIISAALAARSSDGGASEWREYLGGPDRNHYSPLAQINTANVRDLRVAWTYHAGGASPDNRSQIQCNPIVVGGVLYATSPDLQVFALEAATGKELWKFKPGDSHGLGTNRGVTYWESGDERRILFSAGPYLLTLDAVNGKPIASFGDRGRVNLQEGLGRDTTNQFVISNTPGVIYQDLIIMGTRVSEGSDAAPGHIRAYNVRTGKLEWTFHTIPQPGEAGYDTWPKDAYKVAGGANSWAGMAIDRRRGIIYVPTGSPAYDFYGADRKGQNLYANCLLALDAATGKRIWHFQTVHHDILDRDLPAPPNLVTVERDGKKIDAVAQATKSGFVFLFDRETGKPLFPIEEMPFPASTMPGEEAWPTQPVPAKPRPFVRQSMTEADINQHSKEVALLRGQLRATLPGSLFTPPSKQGTVIFPGFDGGAEWGGAAVDPDGVMYVNANDVPWILQMVDVASKSDGQRLSTGQRLYNVNCASCHGIERKGDHAGSYPSLLDLSKKRSRIHTEQIIVQGKGWMPSFKNINGAERQALIDFLFDADKPHTTASAKPEAASAAKAIPFTHTGYNRFVDEDGYPAINPPWGTLSAIDLNTGEYLWKIPLGELKELTARGIAPTGTENYGGPVITAGGVLFIAATKDEIFRALDKKTGRILWETKLPAAGYATPSTYQVNGKQYVVIACGGGKLKTRSGDSYIAFALP